MNAYIGIIQYCYANSTSMLLNSIGETVPPSRIEVLTGVGLGAMWVEEAKLIFFGNWTAAPDLGISKAMEILGFRFEERESDGQRAPLEELQQALENGSVVLGPLNMGHLRYNPNSRYLFGCDHYVLAFDMDKEEVHLHDPAGFPFVSLKLEDLEQAWRAENLDYPYRRSYRYWISPERVESPTEEEIYYRALNLFKLQYKESQEFATNAQLLSGRDAIMKVVERTRRNQLTPPERGHLGSFALQVSAKRSLDYAEFFRPHNEYLATLKYHQANLFGRCHTLFVTRKYYEFADAFVELSDFEEEFRKSLLAVAAIL